MSVPDLMRKKAVLFHRAAKRNPQQAKQLLGAAQSLQFAANVAESGLPQEKPGASLAPEPKEMPAVPEGVLARKQPPA